MAVMAHIVMARILIFMGADHWSKWCLKISMQATVMAKSKKLPILWPFPLYFDINFVAFWAMAYRGSVLWFLFKSAYIYPYNHMG